MRGTFALSVREWAKEAGENADAAVRGVVFDIGSRLIVRSPVDTGRFRSNWFYSEGSPVAATTEETNARKMHGGPGVGMGAGFLHIIQNNLPYALSLERGHSKQAPLGMVSLTAIEFEAIVDGAASRAAGRASLGVLGSEI